MLYSLPRGIFPAAPVRIEDLNFIIGCLSHGQCCSIVAYSNMGKSLLLKSLLNSEVRQLCAQDGAAIPYVIYINCLELGAGDSVQSFYELFTRSLIQTFELQAHLVPLNRKLKSLQQKFLMKDSQIALRALFAEVTDNLAQDLQLSFVIVLDGFDPVFRGLAAWPFGQLRVIRDAMWPRMCYVTGTIHHLDHIRSDAATDDFREVFRPFTRELRPLAPEETEKVIAYYIEKRHIELDKRNIRAAIELSGGHPGLLSHICRILAEKKIRSSSELPKLIEGFAHDANIQNECNLLWQELDDDFRDELARLVKVISSRGIPKKIDVLVKKGLVIEIPQNGYRIFSPLFEEFVRVNGTKLHEATNKLIQCNLETGQIFIDGQDVTESLSHHQRKLLRHLFQNAGKISDVRGIKIAVWGTDSGVSDEAVYELVKRTRKAIEPDMKKPRYIITVVGEGYKLGG